MKKLYETAVILIGTLGWWGYVYPELSMTSGAYVEEAECNEQEEDVDNADASWSSKKGEEAGESKKEDGNETVSSEGDDRKNTSSMAGIIEELGNTGIKVGNIRIKSRIAEYVYQVREETAVEKGAEDDK